MMSFGRDDRAGVRRCQPFEYSLIEVSKLNYSLGAMA